MKTKIKIFLVIFFGLFFNQITQTNSFDIIGDTTLNNKNIYYDSRSNLYIQTNTRVTTYYSYTVHDSGTARDLYILNSSGSIILSIPSISWQPCRTTPPFVDYHFYEPSLYGLDLPSNISLFGIASLGKYYLINTTNYLFLDISGIIALKGNYILLNKDNQAKSYNIDFNNMTLGSVINSVNFDTNCPVYTPGIPFYVLNTSKSSYFFKQVGTDVFLFDKYYSFCKKTSVNVNGYFAPFGGYFFDPNSNTHGVLFHSFNTDQNYVYRIGDVVYDSNGFLTDLNTGFKIDENTQNPIIYFTGSLGLPSNFSNPIITYSDPILNKSYKWDLNCKTAGYTSCKIQQDGQYYCANDTGNLSPNNEKCGKIVVYADENGSSAVSSGCVVQTKTTYGTGTDEGFYGKQDNYDIFLDLANDLFVNNNDLFLNYVDKTTTLTDFYLNDISGINDFTFSDDLYNKNFLFNSNGALTINNDFFNWSDPTFHIYNRNSFNSFKIISPTCGTNLIYKLGENSEKEISFKTCDEVKIENSINNLYIGMPSIKNLTIENILFKKYDITTINDVICHIGNDYTKNGEKFIPTQNDLIDLGEVSSTDSILSSQIQKDILDKIGIQKYLDFFNIIIPEVPYLQIKVPVMSINNEAKIGFIIINSDLNPIYDKLNKSNISKNDVGIAFVSFIVAIFYIVFKFILIFLFFFVFYIYNKTSDKFVSLFLGKDILNSSSGNIVSGLLYVSYMILKFITFGLIFIYLLGFLEIFNFVSSFILAYTSFFILSFGNYAVFSGVVNTFFSGFLLTIFAYILYLLTSKFGRLN